MLKRLLLLSLCTVAVSGRAQTQAPGVDIANLREEVNGLSQRLADLTLRVEQLEAENARLRETVKPVNRDLVTVEQLNQAVADLNRSLQAAVAASPEPTDRAGPAAHPGTGAAFSADFPKEGVNYTVQPGDTLALIAKKTHSRISDIVNANKLSDPSRIQAGQELFIPGGK
jgi:LysM repeat protein